MNPKDLGTAQNSAQSADEKTSPDLSRRGLLKSLSGGVLLASSGALGATLATPTAAEAGEIGPGNRFQRRVAAVRTRRRAANRYLQTALPEQPCNGDETRYGDLRAQFSKTLPHKADGEVRRQPYFDLLQAMDSGDPADFDAIPLAVIAERKLANPQGALAFEMVGLDGHATRIAAPPTFAGVITAAEMGEVYWQALTRDIPFAQYDSDPLIASAVADLNGFSSPVGPKDGGSVSVGTLFRGETPGDLIGPYISQLLWLGVPYGPTPIEQRLSVPVAGEDRMTTFDEWLAIQRGAAPTNPLAFDPTPRYINDGRALGEWVHGDVVFQGYFNAAMILASFGASALSPTNPYRSRITNQGGFVTFGIAQIVDLVTKAAHTALEAAWYQKWSVHRRLRPEAYGGRLHRQITGAKNYGLPSDIVDSDAVARTFAANGTYLLPMAYPEGSPTHPAYPAGHATIAGACCTVLKALFDESFVFPSPVVASADGLSLDPYSGPDLTVGHELNKLAANISLGRDTAGVHYRSDGIEGISAGEQVAIGLLCDYSITYNEMFDGFALTRFDGQPILIKNGEIFEV